MLDENQSPNKLPLLILTPLLFRQDELVGGCFSHLIDQNVELLSLHHSNLRQPISGRLPFIAFPCKNLTNMVNLFDFRRIHCLAYETDVHKWKVNV